MLEVWHLLHRALDKVEHLVLVLIDARLDLLKDLRLHGHNLLKLLFSKLTKITILLGLHGGRGQALVDDRDFTEKISRSEELFLAFYLITATLFAL